MGNPIDKLADKVERILVKRKVEPIRAYILSTWIVFVPMFILVVLCFYMILYCPF